MKTPSVVSERMFIIESQERIIEEIHQARNSILRGVHAGDKVMKLLENLLEALQRSEPVEHIFKTEEYAEAEAYVARIQKIRETKND